MQQTVGPLLAIWSTDCSHRPRLPLSTLGDIRSWVNSCTPSAAFQPSVFSHDDRVVREFTVHLGGARLGRRTYSPGNPSMLCAFFSRTYATTPSTPFFSAHLPSVSRSPS